MSSKRNFFIVNPRMSTVQTVKYYLEVTLSFNRFKKICFLSEKTTYYSLENLVENKESCHFDCSVHGQKLLLSRPR